MLAKAPLSPSELSRAIEEMSDDEMAEMMLPRGKPPGPPTAGGPAQPPGPPIVEERERQPRRRRQSNLKYIDELIEEGGVVWTERVAIARPGYRIVGIRHRTAAGRRGKFVVLTQKIQRKRKAMNGGNHA
jgi:hypothetical protein